MHQSVSEMTYFIKDVTGTIHLDHTCMGSYLYLSRSLQATWIRNSLLRAIKPTGANVRKIPANFVYQYPTVVGLAEFILRLVNGEQHGNDTETTIKQMHSLVEKYSSNLPAHRSQGHRPSSDVYLVTGTTGGLGCALLAYLSGMPNVARIYAINRANKTSLANRQKSSLQERGYDSEAVMGSGKVVLVEAATEDPQLGIPSEIYQEVRYFHEE